MTRPISAKTIKPPTRYTSTGMPADVGVVVVGGRVALGTISTVAVGCGDTVAGSVGIAVASAVTVAAGVLVVVAVEIGVGDDVGASVGVKVATPTIKICPAFNKFVFVI